MRPPLDLFLFTETVKCAAEAHRNPKINPTFGTLDLRPSDNTRDDRRAAPPKRSGVIRFHADPSPL